MTGPVAVPASFAALARGRQDLARHLEQLPRLASTLLEEWELSLDGEARHGHGALVLPVRTRAGRPAVLRLDLPHEEGEHAHLALQAWHGAGAVQLLRADPRRWAMLLERLHAEEDLTGLWDLEACEVVAGLYARLHVPALPQLRRLSSYVDRWTGRLADLPAQAPVPRRLVEQAVALGRSLGSDPATDQVIVHGDLHYANVLAADREPWLVIDPKPVAGDPHYEVAPLLWNRWDEVVASGDVRNTVRRRFHTVVDTALLDEDRARDWVVVRQLHRVLWLVEAARDEDRDLLPGERAEVTAAVAIAKAVQG